MSRFALRVDPAGLRERAAALGALQADVHGAADRLAAMVPQLQASWQGEAASALTAETVALRAQAAAAPPHLEHAQAALRELADVFEAAVEQDLRRLNAAWEQAQEAHRQGVAQRQAQEGQRREDEAGADPLAPPLPPLTGPTVGDCDAELAATERQLEAAFDDLHDELRERTRRAAAGLAEATVVPVPAGVVAFYGVADWSHGLVDWSALTGSRVALPLTALHADLVGALPTDIASLGRLLDRARALDLPPLQYARVLKAFWQARGLAAAGIDLVDWQPDLGLDANRDTVLKVYNYYGELFRAHPGLEWAGMANLVGPGFAAAFADLAQARDIARAAGPGADAAGVKALADLTDAQLHWYESQFLTMQRKIFLDMASSHEAYLQGGLTAIQEMGAAGLLKARDVAAWTDIDTGIRLGDRSLLDQGATGLAHREQFDIIGKSWDQMRDYAPAGLEITYLMTVVGKPSIPGTRAPGDVSPLYIPLSPDKIPLYDPADLPFVPGVPFFDLPKNIDVPQLAEKTKLPDFNVSYRDERWDYFLADTLPAYLHLLDRQDQVQELTAQDLAERIAEERALRRLPEILRQSYPYFPNWHPVVR